MIKLALFCFLIAPSVALADDYNNQLDAKKAQALGSLYSPKCADGGVDSEGQNAKCGVISFGLYDKRESGWRSCKERHIENAACADEMSSTEMAAWRLRYPNADWRSSGLWCQANRHTCNFGNKYGMATFELQLMKTHNQNVHDAFVIEKDRLQLQASEDYAARLKALAPPKKTSIECSPNSFGNRNTTYTCR